MPRKVGEGGGVGVDGELATTASGLVKCSLVPVMEGFQEEEDVSIALIYLVQYVTR